MKYSILFIIWIIFGFGTSCKNNGTTNTNPSPVEPVTSQVPYIIIDTNESQIPDEPKIKATMKILIDNDQIFESNIGIEIRGSSSRRLFEKKSYGFETWDSDGDDLDVTINGLPQEEDWILYGPYSDKTFFRNKLAYDLARKIGEYSSRGFFAELEINENYLGLYILMEKIKRDEVRLNISNLQPDENEGADLTGGYILKIDKTSGDSDNEDWGGMEEYNEFLGFRSNYSAYGEELMYPPYDSKRGEETYYLYEEPDANEITSQQKLYVQQYIDRFESAILGKDFNTVYSEYININSFVDHFLLNELAANPDAYRLSTYLHKDKEGKLNMGPIWDFNIGFGNDWRSSKEGWIYLFNERHSEDLWLVPFYWKIFLEDSTFRLAVKTRWSELKNSFFNEDYIHGMIDTYIEELEAGDAIHRNYEKWDVLGEELIFNSFVGVTYEDEINYLKQWISDRILWMDTQFQDY